MAANVLGVVELIRQADFCQIPITISPTHAGFFPAEIACPIGPETLNSLVV
jgi:hypothetical protein